MIGSSAFPVTASGLPAWSILFAREPEPDVDLEELPDDPEKTQVKGASPAASSPRGPLLKKPQKPKRSGTRPLLLLLLLIVAVAGAYLAMEPGLVMDLIGQGQGNAPPLPSPPAKAPQQKVPAAGAPAAPASTVAKPPVPPAAVASQPAPATSVPAPPTSVSSSAPAVAAPRQAPAAPSTPAPLFGEGQRVVVVGDPTHPTEAASLSRDPAGLRLSFTVTPGTLLTVMDGELRNNGWVYAVRTQQGATGWIDENRLKTTP